MEGQEQTSTKAANSVAAAIVLAANAVLWVTGVLLAVLNGHPVGVLPSTAALAFGVVGCLVLTQRPGNQLGWVLCAISLSMGVLQTGGEYGQRALILHPGGLPGGMFTAWLADTMAIPVVGLFVLVLPQLFPDGQPFSPRWRYSPWAAYGFIVLACVGNAFTAQDLESVRGVPNPYALPHELQPVLGLLILVSLPLGLIALGSVPITLTLRWRRSAGDERQQLKWFIVGIVPVMVTLFVHDVAPVAAGALFALLMPLTALTFGVAILRYRLYDLNLALRRTLIYAVVSALAALIYLGVIAAADAILGASADERLHVVAAVLVAAVFTPLRVFTQRVIDRMFYGDRTRPYDAIARLGLSLEHSVLPEAVLPDVVDTVADALHLPFVAIEVIDGDGDAFQIAATHGALVQDAEPEAFDMTYQGILVGHLLAGPRRTETELHAADRRVLIDIARHTGVAAHAVRTSLALQRSRAELVTAREEERRRLRRDLHDGLGPALAGVTLGLHAAQTQLDSDPVAARALLCELEQQVESAVQDVRRLVYGLRPPALDEFGLVRAVAMHAARLEDGGISVEIEQSTPLGKLPAAVEVAAYRIATEALTNVARHAAAQRATVTFALNGHLRVEVVDDGHGIAPGSSAGVGLAAMRERASELGGSLTVESGMHGTQVVARLPVGEVA